MRTDAHVAGTFYQQRSRAEEGPCPQGKQFHLQGIADDGSDGSARQKDATPIGNHLAFSPDGRLAVSTSNDDDQIFLSDAQTWKVVHRFKGHDGLMATALAFSPDGKRFASGGYDGRVWIWDIESRKGIVKFEGHRTGKTFKVKDKDLESAPPHQVIFSPDGKHVLSFSRGDQAWLWDAATGKQLHRLDPKGYTLECATYSPDGRWILAVLREISEGTREIVILDAQTGKETRRLVGQFKIEHLILDLTVTASGKHVVACCHDATIRTWDIESGKEIKRLPVATKDVVRGFALSRDGRLAVAWDQKMTKKWTTERVELGGGRFEVRATQKLLPDGDPTVHLWDVEIGKQLGSKSHKGHFYTVAFAPDGRRLLLGAEKQVQVWELVAVSPGK
jgi:WD40 repeat protein